MSQEKSGLSGSRSTSVEGRVWIARDLHQKIPTIDEGDFLLIEDNDLTQADAELLIESGVQLVINAALSVTGRVRSRGPQTLISSMIVDLMSGRLKMVIRLQSRERTSYEKASESLRGTAMTR